MECDEEERWSRVQQAQLSTELLTAAAAGDLRTAQRLLESGAAADSACRTGGLTALHLCAAVGAGELSELLLDRGADPELRDDEGRQPHHLAAAAGSRPVLRAVLSRRPALVHSRVTPQATSVHLHLDCVLHTHQHFLNLVKKVPSGSTALHIAARFGFMECITDLVDEFHADVNAKDDSHCPPLNVLGVDITEHFQGRAVRPMTCSNGVGGFSKLTTTIDRSKSSNVEMKARLSVINEMASFLVGKDAHGHQHLHGVTSILHKVVREGKSEELSALLENSEMKKFLKTGDNKGLRPIDIALELRKAGHLEILVEADRELVDMQDKDGYTPLHKAVAIGWTEGVSLLLKFRPSLWLVNERRENVYHTAASKGDETILQVLLTLCSERILNAEDEDGFTPLGRAVCSGNLPCVKLLIMLSDCDRKDLIRWALKERSGKMFESLQKELELTASEMKEAEALHVCLKENNLACLRKVLAIEGLEVEGRDEQGRTVLQVAGELDRGEMLEALLELESCRELVGAGEPLFSASSPRCMLTLLRAGASLAAVNKTSRLTAIQHVFGGGTWQVEMILGVLLREAVRRLPGTDAVEMDFSLLLAGTQAGLPELGVVRAFVDARDDRLRRRFFGHPLVESFLYLRWRRLRPLYNLFLWVFLLHSLLNTALGLGFFRFGGESIANYLKFAMVPTCLFLFIHEGLTWRSDWWREAESWVKWLAILSSLVSVVIPNKELSAVSVLACWVAVLYLSANTPSAGLTVLMFFNVTNTLLKVLRTFMSLLIGFACSFVIIFDGNYPFSNLWLGFSQVLVMMSELGYGDVFEEHSPVGGPLTRVLYLLFLVLVVMVFTNLMVGLSVSDVAELETRGRACANLRQASFLLRYSALPDLSRLWEKLHLKPKRHSLIEEAPLEEKSCRRLRVELSGDDRLPEDTLSRLQAELEAGERADREEAMARAVEELQRWAQRHTQSPRMSFITRTPPSK